MILLQPIFLLRGLFLSDITQVHRRGNSRYLLQDFILYLVIGRSRTVLKLSLTHVSCYFYLCRHLHIHYRSFIFNLHLSILLHIIRILLSLEIGNKPWLILNATISISLVVCEIVSLITSLGCRCHRITKATCEIIRNHLRNDSLVQSLQALLLMLL